jgi:flagellar basal body P-ring protein FlgI
MFMRELTMYVEYLETELASSPQDRPANETAYLTAFRDNLLAGIGYYEGLFGTIDDLPEAIAQQSRSVCSEMRTRLSGLVL